MDRYDDVVEETEQDVPLGEVRSVLTLEEIGNLAADGGQPV